MEEEYCHHCIPLSLSHRHSHPRDCRIRLERGSHRYRVILSRQKEEQKEEGDDNDAIRISYPVSVSQMVDVYFPNDFDADRVIDKMMRDPERWAKNVRYYGKSKEEIKEEWRKKGEESRTLGTQLHEWIELFLNGRWEPPLVTDPDLDSRDPLSAEVSQFLFFYRHMADVRHWTPYRTEWCIFDDHIPFAGTVDAIFWDPDRCEYHLFDWKRSSHWSPPPFSSFSSSFALFPCHEMENCSLYRYFLQLNCYRFMLERNYGLRVASMTLVFFHHELPSYREVPVPDWSDRIERLVDHFFSSSSKEEEKKSSLLTMRT